MSIADVLRTGVALADAITAPLQVTVSHEAYNGDGDYGEPTYAAAVQRLAIVECEQKTVRTLTGTEAVSRARIDFLYDVLVDEKDRFTLPDLSTGPVLDLSGFLDPSTGRGYTTSVWLG